MKTTQLTKDETAKFFANIIANDIEQYNFDAMYDIYRLIETMLKADGSNTQTKDISEFMLLVRKTGCDMLKADSYEEIEQHKKIFTSLSIYKQTFCWNYTYLINVPFCTVEVVK